MAKFKLQTWMSDIRGKQNGSVFSKNRFGNYLRTKTTPINRNTSAQQGVRFNFATLSSGWRGLTAIQRAGWRMAVDGFKKINSLADSVSLTGAQLYISLNRNLTSVQVATISTAPAPVSIDQLTTLGLVAETTTNTIKVSFSGENYTDQNYTLEVSPVLSAGKEFVQNQFKLLDRTTSGDTSPKNITSNYEAMFGQGWRTSAGSAIWVRLTPVNKTTGQAGLPQTAQSIIAS